MSLHSALLSAIEKRSSVSSSAVKNDTCGVVSGLMVV